MKKESLMAIIIAIIAISIFVITSCQKNPSSCTCTESDPDYGYYASQKLDPASFGAKNCSDLAIKLKMSNPDFYYTCN